MKSKIILSFIFVVLFTSLAIPFTFAQYGTLVPIDIGDGTQSTTQDPLYGSNPTQPIPGNNPNDPKINNPLKGGVNDITTFVVYILENIVLPIGVVVVVFFIIYTGFLFVIAQGNPVKIAEARKMFLWVVVGAAILLGSVVISKAIQTTVCKIAPSTWSGCSSQGVPNIIR